jgi:monovalent cation:H+ antiporter-2, CPA2 family
VRMEKTIVMEGSPAATKTLFEIAPAKSFGIQIAGVNRKGTRILSPSGAETLQADDELLVLGTVPQIKAFRAWLRPETDAPKTPQA